ncbi:MAG TPA: TonB-dependent receptor plug domain-containing protein [Opitutaceae bacterium]|nr:TonB-dependent receptor plug domain-containing protein [Opitutaceae bacterium]
MNTKIATALLSAAAMALLLTPHRAGAQAQPPVSADSAAAGETAVQLPAFEIASEKDTDYVGTSSLSSTRIAVDNSELSQSVKVLNHSFIQALNPNMMSDVLDYVGGGQNGALNWTPGRMNIRGFTGDADYVDGFSPTEGSTVDNILFDRFEIIKGPSTIFLAADGSPGGIVNKITKSPLSTPETTLSVQTGLFEGNHVGLDSTGPVMKNGKLLFRVVLGETYYDGYYHNTYMHRMTLMPALTYRFSANTTLELKAELVQTNWPSYNGLPVDPRTLKMINVNYESNQDENSPYNWRHDDVRRMWGSFNTRFNDYLALSIRGMNAFDRADRFESITAPWNEGSRVWASAAVAPATYTGGPIPRSTTNDDAHTTYRDLQADLNFNYSGKGFSELFLLGGEERDQPGRTVTYSGHDTSSPWYPYAQNTIPIITTSTVPSAYTETQSLFQRMYALETLKVWGDRIIMTYGAERAKVYGSNFNYLANSTFVPFTLYKNLIQYGLVIKVLPGVSLFTGYNQNFAANGVGTFNGVPNVPLPAKVGFQHEVGVKTEFLNHRLTANVSYFDISQKNNTVPSFPLDPANPFIVIPGVISRGFDGDFSLKATHDLYLIASFANYSAKSILGPAVNGVFVQPGTGTVAHGSIPVDNTAEQTESLYALYNFPSMGMYKGLSIGIGENFQSKRAVTDGPDQVFWGYVPARTLVDSSINYQYSRQIKYTVTIDNLLDKKYIYSVRSENVQVPGTPFNIKVGISYTF